MMNPNTPCIIVTPRTTACMGLEVKQPAMDSMISNPRPVSIMKAAVSCQEYAHSVFFRIRLKHRNFQSSSTRANMMHVL